MDKIGADFEHVIETIRKRLGARPVAIQIPIGAEAKFRGVIDLIEMRAIVWNDETMGAKYTVEEIPAELRKKAEAFRMQLIETVAENDDDMLHKFLEGETPTPEELKKALRGATIGMKVFPVMCGSAFKNKGVQTLLDAVVDYLPSPLDVPPVEGHDPDNMEEVIYRHSDDSEPLTALGFKIMTDPLCRPVDLCPALFRPPEDRRHSAEPAHAQERAHRAPAQNARQQAGRDYRDLCR